MKKASKKAVKKIAKKTATRISNKFKTGDTVVWKHKATGLRMVGHITHLREINNTAFAYVKDKAGNFYYPSLSVISKKK